MFQDLACNAVIVIALNRMDPEECIKHKYGFIYIL